MRSVLSSSSALIYVMVITSASDAEMSDRELHAIGEIVKTLPAFSGFDPNNLLPVARECATVLGESDGLDQALGLVKEALPPHLAETAYVLALDIALSSEPVHVEEMRILDRLRVTLGLDPLVSVALERAARARFQRP
ncbi:MAG: Tellurite resistance protein TerB [Alphaproteobacteria bacterium]|nr:Tellurite resistance protein TerB [Alphaproteobacteria bacterium]